MRADELAGFPLSPEFTMLNHASFGVVSTRVMAHADALRAEFEADSHTLVDVDALLPRIRDAASTAACHLGLDPRSFAFTQNATSGGAAIIRSMPLRPGGRVVVLSTEYPSIIRGWEVRCAEVGAELVRVAPPLPLTSVEQLIDCCAQHVTGPVDVVQLSLVSSSTAVHFPIGDLAQCFRDRGAQVVVDAAHGPGHVAIDPEGRGAAAVFGTLHKWFPTPRPVGFIWVGDQLRDLVRPAVVSLTWDADELLDRFEWPGTYDPIPRLSVGVALDQWSEWEASGRLARSTTLADVAAARLSAVGVTPTADSSLVPPRLRAFLAPAWARDDLRGALHEAKLRVWTGYGPEGQTIVRLATHIYNDEEDIERTARVLNRRQP